MEDLTAFEQLRCHYCQGYLSIAPIYISKSGRNACGRCREPKESTETWQQNIAYETLAFASSAIFPCKNNKAGCKIRMKMNEIGVHEEICTFSRVTCPIEDCRWTDVRSKLVLHCQAAHKDHVTAGSCTYKPGIRIDSEKMIVLEKFGYLFVLQVRCDTSEGSIWLNVSLLGPGYLSNIFDYTVHVQGKGGCIASITTKRKIRHQDSHEFQKEYAVLHRISNLREALGHYHYVSFEVSVSMDAIYCGNCSTLLEGAPILQNKQAMLVCGQCQVPLQTSDVEQVNMMDHVASASNPATAVDEIVCKYNDRGCYFKHSDQVLVLKHQRWTCCFSNFCAFYGCERQHLRLSYIDHLIQCQSTPLLPTCISGSRASVMVPLNGARHGYSGTIRAHGAVFFLRIKFISGTQISIYLTCAVEQYGHDLYTGLYIVPARNQNMIIKLSPNTQQDGICDWYNHINLQYIQINKSELTLILTKL